MATSFTNNSRLCHQMYDTDIIPSPYNVTILNKNLKAVDDAVNTAMGTQDYTARWMIVVTYVKVHPAISFSSAQHVSYQAVITTDGVRSFYIVIYEGFTILSVNQRPQVAGHVLGTQIHHVTLSTTPLTQLDEWVGNQDDKGYYVYEISDPGAQGTTPLIQCLNWYRDSINDIIPNPYQHMTFSDFMKCPCTDATRDLDWRYRDGSAYTYLRNGMNCVAATLTDIYPGTRECCYYANGTINLDESRFLRSFPNATNYAAHDGNPKNQCCNLSDKCNLWRELRPTTECRTNASIAIGQMHGDPHFETLDGLRFTFNGLGEYIMTTVKTETHDFEIQSRTGKAVDVNGTALNATVFKAFAGKDRKTNASFHVEISHDSKTMVIYLNGRDFTFDFYNNANFRLPLNNKLSAVRVGEKLAVGFSGISITVHVAVRMLLISPSVSDVLAGQVSGLLGNFNGNSADDLIYSNGTSFQKVNPTEQDIFNYAQTWAVTESTSIFLYEFGQTYATVNDPTFTPLFLSDFANTTALQEATQICGTDSTTCIYDYLLTRDLDVAKQTNNTEIQATATRILITNVAPVITGTSLIHAEVGKLTSFTVTVSDPDQVNPPAFQIVTQPVSGFSLDTATGLLSWTPQNTDIASIGITAVDDLNVGGRPLIVDIILCPGCSGQGTCNYTQTLSSSNVNFQLAVCQCDTGYEGNECAQDINGCVDNPCSVKRNCTDLSPAEEVLFGRAYNCSECPAGYLPDGLLCTDLIECLNSSLYICDQNSNCENTEGSYICNCKIGYRDINNACVDINECVEDTDGCEQTCVNNDSNFTCDCFIGYQLDGDGITCNRVIVLDECDQLNCSYACTNETDSGNFECACPGGYEVDGTGKQCVDVNECERNICQQDCTNSVGSYECVCVSGFSLHADKTSCDACSFPAWGVNCADICNCGEGASTCDTATGCVCKSGWTGRYCKVDVNECVTDPLICGADKTCENIQGHYRCNCPSGYEQINNVCVNINECTLNTHLCTASATCEDNIGSYSCVCPPGYASDGPYTCTNIDECALGSHACSQICRDVEGSFNCFCYDGFQLGPDRSNCVKVSEACAAFSGLTCDYACRIVNGNPVCYCESGYQLALDLQTCQDVNECTTPGLSQCSHECTNTPPGGYTCSCSIGSQLENDGRTCAVCDGSHWGQNCANQCSCGAFGTDRCDKVIGCVCKDGWTGAQCTDDVNECLFGDKCPDANEECINTPGSYVCHCMTGYSNTSGTCQDINECSGTNICSQDCDNTVGSYTCKCFSGFVGSTECADIDECGLSQHVCSQNCFNSIGSYRCSCNDGFELDLRNRKDCIVKTECSPSNACNQTCAVNSNGQEFCSCERGHALEVDNTSCTNIDECLNKPCSQNCEDLTPDYRCSCNAGYNLQNDGISCSECNAGLYGINCSQPCACNADNTLECNKTDGVCTCKTGWNGTTCEANIDECALGTSNCGPLTTCVDRNGSFICDCNKGYAVTQAGQCTECSTGRYGYHCEDSCTCDFQNTASCDKVNGTCACMGGWNGSNCDSNIDECSLNSSLCGVNSNCIDTNGSYACECLDGYYKHANGTCLDLDECFTGPNNCSQYANCTNMVPYFDCTCKTGFTGDGYTCKDINECTTGSHNCLATANCTNTIGSHTCNCKDGLIGDGISSCIATTTVTTTTVITTQLLVADGNTTIVMIVLVINKTFTTVDCSNGDLRPSLQAAIRNATMTAVPTVSVVQFPYCQNGNLLATLKLALDNTQSSFASLTQYLADVMSGTKQILDGSTPLSISQIKALSTIDSSLLLNMSPTTTLCDVFDQLHHNVIHDCPFITPTVAACFNATGTTSSHTLIVTLNNTATVITSTVRLAALYALRDYFNNYTTGCADLYILNITIGIRVEINITVNSGDTSQSSLVDVLKQLSSLTLNGIPATVQQIQVVNPDGSVSTINPAAAQCVVFEQLNQCAIGYACIERNGQSECLTTAKADDMALIIGLGIGLPLLVLVVALSVAILVYQRRMRNARKQADARTPAAGFFTHAIMPKYNSWGRPPYHNPDRWTEAGSSSSSDSRRRADKFFEEDQRFPTPVPQYDNSNFLSTWDFVHNTGEEFKIRRPKIRVAPDPFMSNNEKGEGSQA